MAKKVKSVSPCDDSSRSVFGVGSSIDIHKGTSFNFGEWKSNHHYYRDEYIIDFVSYVDKETGEASMWVCNKNHVSTSLNRPGLDNSWSFVMGGSYSGGQGGSGLIYIPEMVDGTLIFRLSNAPGNELIEIGDLHEEIHIGEDEPDDKRKVWLDPSEISVNNVNSLDLVYNAYILAGGSLSKASFIKAFKNIS